MKIFLQGYKKYAIAGHEDGVDILPLICDDEGSIFTEMLIGVFCFTVFVG